MTTTERATESKKGKEKSEDMKYYGGKKKLI
jgi:hypothetical protein